MKQHLSLFADEKCRHDRFDLQFQSILDILLLPSKSSVSFRLQAISRFISDLNEKATGFYQLIQLSLGFGNRLHAREFRVRASHLIPGAGRNVT